MAELENLMDLIRAFVRERDWEQFHDPKNLSMALASEAGELCSELRWVPSSEADAWCAAPEQRARIADELADVAIVLLMLVDRVGLDLGAAVRAKLERNAAKYPADDVRGRYD
jgi:NTP pyrophosphatase (non-canonical NTP hydrolase)